MSYAYRDQDQDQEYSPSNPPPAPYRPQSSYYNPHPHPTSPLDVHAQDEPFDVRADFDGDGPRWSERYGPPQSQPPLTRDSDWHGSSSYGGIGGGSEGGYKPVDDHVAPKGGALGMGARSENGEEMVSVPVLGPDWQKSELYDLSRRGRADIKSEKRTLAWRSWTRGQSGLCGVKWLTKRLLVFGIFIFLAALGVTLFFVIPRNPAFSFYVDRPFDVDNSTISFSRTPTNFSFTGNLNLYADASSSYIPVQFSNLQAKVYDLQTNKVIATGDLGKYKVDNAVNQAIILPVTFSYSALNTTDPTWVHIYEACGHLWPGTVRPDLKFRLVLQSSIVGLTNKPDQSTQISDVTCPFELGVNSV